MTNLITHLEFAAYRDISKKLDESKINESIKSAQETDLLSVLGDFYFDVVKNSELVTYEDLMNGSEYIEDGEIFEHAGIKRLLADYAYARHVMSGNVNLTAFGIHAKLSNDSELVKEETIKSIARQSQKDAGMKFIYIEKYILTEPILFKRYCKNKKSKGIFHTQRFSKL